MSSIKDAKTLKGLQSILAKLEAELSLVDSELKTLQNKKQKLEYSLSTTKKKIERFKNNRSTLIVSEHAVLRFLERTYNLDVEKIKNTIAEGLPLGTNGKFPKNGHSFVIKNNTIITVL